MKCDAVIAVTVQYGHGNEELLAAWMALEEKYRTKQTATGVPVHFINVLGDKGTYEDTLSLRIQSEMVKLDGILKAGGKIGLYWGVHGNSTTTDPSAKDLAGVTAMLYKMGLAFAKISISACNSAGAKEMGKFTDTDVTDSATVAFCRELSSSLPDPTVLDGVMVAGYRAAVVMYDAENVTGQHYFKGLKSDANNTFSPGITRVQNTFVDGKKYVETHPRLTEQQSATLRQDLTEHRAALGQANTPKKKKNVSTPYQDRLRIYNQIEQYILKKLVFEYQAQTGQWTLGSIARFTDNADIRAMITEVEPLLGNDRPQYRIQLV
jgi:hypothetical protein